MPLKKFEFSEFQPPSKILEKSKMSFTSKSVGDAANSNKFWTPWVVRTSSQMPLKNFLDLDRHLEFGQK